MTADGDRLDALADLALERLKAHREQHTMEQDGVKTALDAEKHRLEDHRLAHAAANAAGFAAAGPVRRRRPVGSRLRG